MKRTTIFELAVTLGGAYYLGSRISPPRTAIIALTLLGTVVLHQVGSLRAAVDEGRTLTSAILSGEIFQRFEYLNLESAHEIRQAKSDFEFIDKSMWLRFGADYWNQLTHQYVPAFIVGREFKNSLKLDTIRTMARDNSIDVYFSRGATRTGFSDTFESFWFAGALVFGLMGLVGGVLYARVLQCNLTMQFFYLILMSRYLVTVSHSTSTLIAYLPFLLITMLTVFRF